MNRLGNVYGQECAKKSGSPTRRYVWLVAYHVHKFQKTHGLQRSVSVTCPIKWACPMSHCDAPNLWGLQQLHVEGTLKIYTNLFPED